MTASLSSIVRIPLNPLRITYTFRKLYKYCLASNVPPFRFLSKCSPFTPFPQLSVRQPTYGQKSKDLFKSWIDLKTITAPDSTLPFLFKM